MTTCIDLQERFSSDYKVVSEDDSGTKDPWRQILRCRGENHIFPYGGDYLGAAIDGNGRILVKLFKAAPTAEIVQSADDGINIKFHVSDFDAVASILRARKRRKLSEEHAAILRAVGTVYRFRPASGDAADARYRVGGDKADKRAA